MRLPFSQNIPGLLLCASLILSSVCVLVRAGETPATGVLPSDHCVGQTQLPVAELRGYGRVEATNYEYNLLGRPATILAIVCEDDAKAKLTQAKYLSDLTVLQGTELKTLPTARGELQYRRVEDQGAIAAVRAGSRVFLLAADSPAALGLLYEKHLPEGAAVSRAEMDVPMWLDRWDKYGFRCYYSRPLLSPDGPDGKQRASYDFLKEFDFAAKTCGLIFWDHTPHPGTSEGLRSLESQEWALQLAAKNKIPMAWNSVYGATPLWLANRLRRETFQIMPQYSSEQMDFSNQFESMISYSSPEGQRLQRSLLTDSVRRLNRYDNLVSWMEFNCEFGTHMMYEYGPIADRDYRRYLQQTYGDIALLAKRWTGSPQGLKSWDDVRVPEVASFAGWGDSAIDLAGDWRIRFQNPQADGKQPPLPTQWLQAQLPEENDWPTLTAPGNDKMMFVIKNDPSRPSWARGRVQQAVYRRKATVSAEWLAKHPRVWLYAWDLNSRYYATVSAWVNGKPAKADPVGSEVIKFGSKHWAAYDVTGLLQAGDNQFSLVLPSGSLGYKVYLSPVAPAQYPHLGETTNARWADFVGWREESRLRQIEDGIKMLRQIDPNRQISFADPAGAPLYYRGLKKLGVKYGGEIHNTGYMGGIWADIIAQQMRSAGLPVSAELGEPAPDAENFKYKMGLYFTEGLQGLDYFMHINDLMWNEPVRRQLEATLKEVRLIGKYHAPRAQVAILNVDDYYSQHIWDTNDPNANLPGGYWSWPICNAILPEFDRDALLPGDFADGNAAKYRVILDTNTAIMDEKLVDGIEEYVRSGGVFVTFVQTGRHSPTIPDSWPISRLTGYRVTGFDKLNPDGSLTKGRYVRLADRQNVFPAAGFGQLPIANGLTLIRTAPECIDLMLWNDKGEVAAGMRPLGKGMIVTLGMKFSHDSLWRGDSNVTAKMFIRLLDYFNVARVPAQCGAVEKELYSSETPGTPPPPAKHAQPLMFRHYVTNNGLYDVWTIWNSLKKTQTVSLRLDSGNKAEWAINVRTGERIPVQMLRQITLEPLETKNFLTPRNAVTSAPQDWFRLQSAWWRGTARPQTPPVEAYVARNAIDLTRDWRCLPLDLNTDPAKTPDLLNAKGGESRTLTVYPRRAPGVADRMIFSREFAIPPAWSKGKIRLWLMYDQSNHTPPNARTVFADQGRIFLDGTLLRDFSPLAYAGEELTDRLAPGSTHTLSMDITGNGSLNGFIGLCWLSYEPMPLESINLAGVWEASKDVLHYDAKLNLPGEWNAYSARRKVTIPATLKGKDIYFSLDYVTRAPTGVLINGRWLRGDAMFGHTQSLNITPWVRWGEENEIELVYLNDSRKPEKFTLTRLALDVYPAE